MDKSILGRTLDTRRKAKVNSQPVHRSLEQYSTQSRFLWNRYEMWLCEQVVVIDSPEYEA